MMMNDGHDILTYSFPVDNNIVYYVFEHDDDDDDNDFPFFYLPFQLLGRLGMMLAMMIVGHSHSAKPVEIPHV